MCTRRALSHLLINHSGLTLDGGHSLRAQLCGQFLYYFNPSTVIQGAADELNERVETALGTFGLESLSAQASCP